MAPSLWHNSTGHVSGLLRESQALLQVHEAVAAGVILKYPVTLTCQCWGQVQARW